MKTKVSVGASKISPGSVYLDLTVSGATGGDVASISTLLTNYGARQLRRELNRAIKEANARDAAAFSRRAPERCEHGVIIDEAATTSAESCAQCAVIAGLHP